jgi:anti-anti-sigma factor
MSGLQQDCVCQKVGLGNAVKAKLEIGERWQAGLLVLAPVGRIDNLISAEFRTRLLGAVTSGSADVVVDFSGVEYISSCGLNALMTASRQKSKERRLAVASLDAVVHEIFTISRFTHLVSIFATVEEASAAWNMPSPPQPAEPRRGFKPDPDASLRVRFWGARGLLPAPLREHLVRGKIRDALLAARGRILDAPWAIDAFIDEALPFSVRGTYGGNTSCVEIIAGDDEYVLCDLGTGIREFGNHVLREHGRGRKHCFNIFLSHPHWDHIMGFPFFAPAYIPGNRIRIYSCHQVLEQCDGLGRNGYRPALPVKDYRQHAGRGGGLNALPRGTVFRSKPPISRTRSIKPTGLFRQTWSHSAGLPQQNLVQSINAARTCKPPQSSLSGQM